jgi:protein TonB
MRIVEPLIALTASAALHAGALMFVPATPQPSHAPAPMATAQGAVIVAHLKNTLDAKEPRKRTAKYAEHGRPARAPAAARKPRIDNAQRFYPAEAVARGLEGETILMLTYRADGTLLDAKVAKSSGHAILDEAALRAIRAAPRMEPGQREMLFPVTFALQ